VTEERSESERRESIVAYQVWISATFKQHAHRRLVTEERSLHQRRHAVSIARIDIVDARQQTQHFIYVAALSRAQQM
jgi:hypothetical protein